MFLFIGCYFDSKSSKYFSKCNEKCPEKAENGMFFLHFDIESRWKSGDLALRERLCPTGGKETSPVTIAII